MKQRRRCLRRPVDTQRLSPAISVREALPEDGPRLREVGGAALRILRRTYRPSPGRLAARGGRRVGGGTELVAVADDRVVGRLTYRREGRYLHLRNLAVDPSYHRRGVARELVETALTRAVEGGLRGLEVETIRETGNVPIFERLGFSVVSETPSELMEGISGETVTDVFLRRYGDPSH